MCLNETLVSFLLILSCSDGARRKTIEQIALHEDFAYMSSVLQNITIPRLSGTEGNRFVQNYLIQELTKHGFSVELDRFTTPTIKFGNVQYTNIIGTLNPYADSYIVLAAHFDTKYFEFEFLGAIDSAVSCAMILNLIRVLQPDLESIKHNRDVSLMVIFFDGEEAQARWTDTDSLYGSRHLAQMWETDFRPTNQGDLASRLQRIRVFLLLDLLGPPDVVFNRYFETTHNLYDLLIYIETLLRQHNLLLGNRQLPYFADKHGSTPAQDDHLPFLARGVPVLYWMPEEFPQCWHTEADTLNAVDFHTVKNLNTILRVFVAIYLGIII